ncbi:hypothetical protein HYX16_01100 [Candidatus Woesearchaeota archaeon]|nr:hypothetical protein [Candidatus Woesearchaeota archaeon]
MKKTLQYLAGSLAIVSSLSGCGSNKPYLLTQEDVEKMSTWAARENTDDITRYLHLKQKIEKGDIEGAKNLVDFCLKEEKEKWTVFINFLENNQPISDKTKAELIKLVEYYINKAEKK